jgi:quercetin dioxygenase-like cupin family protein
MTIPVVKPTLAEVNKCIARFSKLVRCDTGIPDMALPEGKRTFLNVLGFSQPKGGSAAISPFGDQAPAAVSHLKAGFGISFIGCRPGQGVLMHNHDTVETFLVISGKWKLEYELDVGNHYSVLEPLDFIACPIGIERRFECIESPAGQEEALLLGIVGGDAPSSEASPGSIQRCVDAGILTAEQARTRLQNTATGVW